MEKRIEMWGNRMRSPFYVLALLLVLAGVCVPVSALLTNYNYYQIHNITGSASWADNQTNYPIYLDLYNGTGTSSGSVCYLNNHALNFPNDIVFTASDGTTLYPNWTQPDTINNTYARAWFNVSTILKTGNTSIYVYYGKQNYSFTSNISAVFPFGDDFGGEMLINDTANPVRPTSIEESLIQDPTNFTIVDNWYRANTYIYYTNATNSLVNNWGAATNLSDINSFFGSQGAAMPFVVYDNTTSKYYMFVSNYTSHYMYLFNSTNKINWSVMNGGNPVCKPGYTAATYDIFNPGVCVVNGTWHMLLEGKANGASRFTESYTYSNLTELNWSAHLSSAAVIDSGGGTGAGNPYLTYVPDRNSLFVVTGYSPSTTWQIYTAYANISTNLGTSANWTVNTAQPLISVSGVHVADPTMVVTNYSKSHNIIMAYNYNQVDGWQKYSDLSLTQFFDQVKGASIDTSSWSVVAGTATPFKYNGYLWFNSTSNSYKTISTFNFNHSSVWRMYNDRVAGESTKMGDYSTTGNAQMYRNIPFNAYSSTDNFATYTKTSLGDWGNAWNIFKIQHNATHNVFTVNNGAATVTDTTKIYSNAISLMLGHDAASAKNDYWDYVFITPYAYPEPSHSDWQAEQQGGIFAPVASFTTNISGSLPITKRIELTDTSINTPTSWQWNMGDGTSNYTQQNVTYHYTKRGLWQVVMTATNSAGSSSNSTWVRVVGG